MTSKMLAILAFAGSMAFGTVSGAAVLGSPSDRLDVLKQEILTLARSGQGRCLSDTDKTLRRELDRKVDQLLAWVPQRRAPDQLRDLVGAWKQVWSDGPFSTAPGACLHSDQIYQVVYPTGYYWNLSKTTLASGDVLTGLLRGAFEVQEENLAIRFTKQTSKPGYLEPGESVIPVTMQAEAGAFDDGMRDGEPIGRSGVLDDVYLDEDLRISRGGGEQFGGTYLYILIREDQVQ